MDDPEALGKLLDQLIADGFVLRVFMLQVALELASGQADPQAWARQFISTLHERVDSNEAETRRKGGEGPSHEHARETLDQIGRHLVRMLALPPS